jgi:hypothetical protein
MTRRGALMRGAAAALRSTSTIMTAPVIDK